MSCMLSWGHDNRGEKGKTIPVAVSSRQHIILIKNTCCHLDMINRENNDTDISGMLSWGHDNRGEWY
jgi:hypothetical protein